MNSLAVQDIPGKCREELINCRNCKRILVKFLGKYFLDITGAHLCSEQALYVAGAFDGDITDTVWFVRGGCRAQPEPALSCNAEETDTRLWLHVKQTHFTIISPDTDIYHIELPLQCVKEKNVLVQVSPISSRSIQLVNITELINALHHDPDPDSSSCDSNSVRRVWLTTFLFLVRWVRQLSCSTSSSTHHL